MSGALYCRSELTAPWSIAMPVLDDCLMFHFVTAGRCRLEMGGAESSFLEKKATWRRVARSRGHLIANEAGLPTVGCSTCSASR